MDKDINKDIEENVEEEKEEETEKQKVEKKKQPVRSTKKVIEKPKQTAKVHKVGKDYLLLVDKNKNGIRIPLESVHKNVKKGDIVEF